jgi:mono/diheme cytochrome c family protein
MSWLVASIGGIFFFVFSVILLAVLPGRALEEQTRRMSPAKPLHYTASEERGRQIYSREGCAYCHTQQIRYLERDSVRFGAPTLAWETQFDYPHLWGTRRIGPDLSREGAVRPEDWQLQHLYAPRSVVPDSVMPPFAGLFDGAPDRPTQEGLDLVAYLVSLGRPRELAGPEGEKKDDMPDMPQIRSALNNNPAMARRDGPFPLLKVAPASPEGERLVTHNCLGCHGKDSDGKGPGAQGLEVKPRNLASHEYTLARLSRVLWNGVAGTAMPGWRDFSDADRARFAAQVRIAREVLPEPEIPAGTLELGQSVYREHCQQCHGENGGGDGSAAKEERILPADFRTGRPSLAASTDAVRNGVAGTPMAPWNEKLSAAEVSAVAYYVRTFFQPDRQ